jgi:hypothetical protein
VSNILGEYEIFCACRDALATGLAAQVEGANAQLTAAGRALQLVAPTRVLLVDQLAQAPAAVEPPEVHLAPSLLADFSAGASASNVRQPASCDVEVGVYLLSPGAVDGLTEEGALVASLLAWRTLVRRTLRRPQARGGVEGRGGISRIRTVAARHELWRRRVNTNTALGGLVVVTLRVDFEE